MRTAAYRQRPIPSIFDYPAYARYCRSWARYSWNVAHKYDREAPERRAAARRELERAKWYHEMGWHTDEVAYIGLARGSLMLARQCEKLAPEYRERARSWAKSARVTERLIKEENDG